MSKTKCLLIIFTLLLATSLFSRENKREEVKQEGPKKEEPKQEEPKQEEPKQEEPKKDIKAQSSPKQKECYYHVLSLGNVENPKFDDEVKKIEDTFAKCERFLVKEKEQEAKSKECKLMEAELKSKKSNVLKPIADASKVSKKEDFAKVVAEVKAARVEYTSLENKYKENCPVVKKHESNKVVKKEEDKKDAPKKDVKKDVKKEEFEKEESEKEEAKN